MGTRGALFALALLLVGLVPSTAAAGPPFKPATAHAGCVTSGSTLSAVSAPVPRARMEARWRGAHHGAVAAALWVDLVVQLQVQRGAGWTLVVSKHRPTLVRTRLKPLKPVGALPVSDPGTYRVVETLRFLSPKTTKSDHVQVITVPGTCTRAPAPVAPPPPPPPPPAAWRATSAAAAAGLFGGKISGVSCTSQNWCMAIGQDTASEHAATWNGASWEAQAAPQPPADIASMTNLSTSLVGLSCSSPAFCVATSVDSYYDSDNWQTATHDDVWNGSSWSPHDANGGKVSCPTDSFCATIVGSSAVALGNGAQWSSPPPGVLSQNPKLSAVSCVAANSCTVVGSLGSGTGAPFAARYTTQAGWTTIGDFTGLAGSFSDVSCATSTACVAVTSTGFVEAWNGTSWAESTFPTGATSAQPRVSCSSASLCEVLRGDGAAFTWNGSQTAADVAGSPAVPSGPVAALSCVASLVCVAVGGDGSTPWAAVRTP